MFSVLCVLCENKLQIYCYESKQVAYIKTVLLEVGAGVQKSLFPRNGTTNTFVVS